MRRSATWLALAAVALVLQGGCQSGLEDPRQLPDLDEAMFRCEVEPVIVARCGFYPCHGSAQRPFRVYGVNRLRLNPPRGSLDYVINQPLTDEEHRANYDMALSFGDVGQLDSSQLLSKPLDVAAGGQFHRGKSLYGAGDVFLSTTDPGYLAIQRWLDGGTRPEDCFPFEEVGP